MDAHPAQIMERLSAIVFDLGDTLFPEVTLRYECMAEASRQLGAEGRLRDVERFRRSYRSIDARIPGHDVNHLFSDERIVRRVLEDCGEQASQSTILRYLAIHRNEVWTRLSEVDGLPSLFASLRRRGLKVGVLTDGTTYEQYMILARLKVLGLVDEVVTSEELGVTKPSPRMFSSILNRLDVPADRTLMVGNSLERDIKGARDAGMRTAYLTQETGGDADLVIRDVMELESVLAK